MNPHIIAAHERYLLILYAHRILCFDMRQARTIDELIAEKIREIVNAEHALHILRVELATLEKANKLAGNSHPRLAPLAAAEPVRRGRSLSEPWRRVLAVIAKRRQDGASLDEIFSYCQLEGIKMQRTTLRAQMSNYVKRGYLGRTGDGKFFLALHGLRAAGLAQGNGDLDQISDESRE